MSKSMAISRMAIKPFVIKLNFPGKKLHIVLLGDTHYGNTMCRVEELKDMVAWIASKKNVYWIGMGDYCDFIDDEDKRWDPSSVLPHLRPRKDIIDLQLEELSDILAPIAPKCLALLAGNHEEAAETGRNGKSPVSIGLNYLLTPKLGELMLAKYSNKKYDTIPYLGSRGILMIDLFDPKTKKKIGTKRIYAAHKPPKGGMLSTVVRGLLLQPQTVIADVYAYGHIHKKLIVPDTLMLPRGKEYYTAKLLHVISGSYFLTYDNDNTESYAKKANYKQADIGVTKVTFVKEEGHISLHASL